MLKQSYLLIIFIVLLFISCKDEKVAEVVEQKPPNIIYILADDLGYGDISSFNPSGKIKTPNIDELAITGMRFTDAHSSSAVCTPTRYGILTGRYSWRSPLKSGVVTGKSKALIPENRATVASLLKKSGYHTAFIGKWHLGWNWAEKDTIDSGGDGWNPEDFENLDFSKDISHSPNELGFDYSYGLPASLDIAPYVYVENNKITAKVDSVTVDTGKYTWWREGPTASDFIHEDVTPNFFRRSMDYIKGQSQQEAPFFLYLALPSPHTPILPTADWLGKSGINPYADFIMQIDDYIGQLVTTLEEQGITENTMIVFTSDNGPSPFSDFEILAQHGHDPRAGLRGHKADIYEGGHRIPFIVKWPAKITPNKISNVTISLTDFMATCAAIVQNPLKDNEGEDSFSLLALLVDKQVGTYRREATVHHSVNGSFAIRKGKYKLIFVPGSGGWSYPIPGKDDVSDMPKFQLYNLDIDASENKNLVLEYPDVVQELKELMVSYIENGRSTPGLPQQNSSLHLNGDEWHQIDAFMKE